MFKGTEHRQTAKTQWTKTLLENHHTTCTQWKTSQRRPIKQLTFQWWPFLTVWCIKSLWILAHYNTILPLSRIWLPYTLSSTSQIFILAIWNSYYKWISWVTDFLKTADVLFRHGKEVYSCHWSHRVCCTMAPELIYQCCFIFFYPVCYLYFHLK